MKVIRAFPPNWPQIAKVFPVKGRPGILYAYGDRLYNPSGVIVTPWIMAHEEVHGQRQMDGSWAAEPCPHCEVEDWWRKYMVSPEFRLNEELLAHQAEWHAYKHIMQVVGKDSGYLDLVAGRLSSPLYGSLITYDDAKRRIAE